jgi:hypothetical protein
LFSAILKEVTGILDHRFLLTFFLPSLFFWGSLTTVLVAGQADVLEVVKSWNKQDAFIQVLEIVGFIAWVLFFASILAGRSTGTLRFYEGYWSFPLGSRLHRAGQAWHQERLRKLDAAGSDAYEAIYLYYPLPTQEQRVMPTRLGNILRNAELYAWDRYGIDPVLVWPRLYNLLPERFVNNLADAQTGMDFMLTISIWSLAFTLLSGVYLLGIGGDWLLFFICVWGGTALTLLAYHGALNSALVYAQQIKAAFDLYRNELLKQMGITLPSDMPTERERWARVRDLLFSNVPQDWTYGEVPLTTKPAPWWQALLKRIGLCR